MNPEPAAFDLVATADDHDTIVLARLAAIAADLDEIRQALAAPVIRGRSLPWSIRDILSRLATAAEQCERVVEEHATGAARVADDTLAAVAAALRMLREVATALGQAAEKQDRL
jgi:hypothetical protein